MAPKRRIMTISERAALRRHAQQNPRLRQAGLQDWFEATYGFKISQGTVSDSLNTRFQQLDNLPEDHESSVTRFRAPKWPELEDALADWRREHYGDDEPVPDATMRAQAAVLWETLPVYIGEEVPNFSNGWLQGFKKRNGMVIRARRSNGEFYRQGQASGDVTGPARTTGTAILRPPRPQPAQPRRGPQAQQATPSRNTQTQQQQRGMRQTPGGPRSVFPATTPLSADDMRIQDLLRQETERDRDTLSTQCLARLNALHPFHLNAILYSAALRHKDVRDALCIGDTEMVRTPYAWTAKRNAERLFRELEGVLADDNVFSSMGYTVDAQATHQFQCTRAMLDYLATECTRHLSPRYTLEMMRTVVLAICETSAKDVMPATRATIEKYKAGNVFPDAMMGVVEGLSEEGRKGVLTELFEQQLVEMEAVCVQVGVFAGMDKVRLGLGEDGAGVVEEWRASRRGREVLEGTFDGRWS